MLQVAGTLVTRCFWLRVILDPHNPFIRFPTAKCEILSRHTSWGCPFGWLRWFPSHAWLTKVSWKPKLPINTSPRDHFSKTRIIFFILCAHIAEIWHFFRFESIPLPFKACIGDLEAWPRHRWVRITFGGPTHHFWRLLSVTRTRWLPWRAIWLGRLQGI